MVSQLDLQPAKGQGKLIIKPVTALYFKTEQLQYTNTRKLITLQDI